MYKRPILQGIQREQLFHILTSLILVCCILCICLVLPFVLPSALLIVSLPIAGGTILAGMVAIYAVEFRQWQKQTQGRTALIRACQDALQDESASLADQTGSQSLSSYLAALCTEISGLRLWKTEMNEELHALTQEWKECLETGKTLQRGTSSRVPAEMICIVQNSIERTIRDRGALQEYFGRSRQTVQQMQESIHTLQGSLTQHVEDTASVVQDVYSFDNAIQLIIHGVESLSTLLEAGEMSVLDTGDSTTEAERTIPMDTRLQWAAFQQSCNAIRQAFLDMLDRMERMHTVSVNLILQRSGTEDTLSTSMDMVNNMYVLIEETAQAKEVFVQWQRELEQHVHTMQHGFAISPLTTGREEVQKYIQTHSSTLATIVHILGSIQSYMERNASILHSCEENVADISMRSAYLYELLGQCADSILASVPETPPAVSTAAEAEREVYMPVIVDAMQEEQEVTAIFAASGVKVNTHE